MLSAGNNLYDAGSNYQDYVTIQNERKKKSCKISKSNYFKLEKRSSFDSKKRNCYNN